MYDLHYDLLTIIYVMSKENKIDYLRNWCSKIYNSNNINGGIINLYFTSKDEMKEELNISGEIDVIEMFKTVTGIINKNKLLPNNNFLYGIEGCDYLDITDLKTLYDYGLRLITPFWNNENIYGSGNRSKKGLTKKGEELIIEAIRLGIIIDLSHANEKSFWDMIKIIKQLREEGSNPLIMATHSNCKDLFDKQVRKLNLNAEEIEKAKEKVFYKRNLTDEQLLAIKELDGLVGLVTHKTMSLVTLDDNLVLDNKKDKQYERAFLEHLSHLKNLFGSTDNIMFASDDMSFLSNNDLFYGKCNLFEYENLTINMKNLLISNGYNNLEIESLLKDNFQSKVLDKQKKNQ